MSLPAQLPDPAPADPNVWFAADVGPHASALRNWLRVRFPGVVDPEDLVQESMMRVWRARAQGTTIASAKAFLFATARNLALDILNRRGPQRIGENAALAVLDDRPNPVDTFVHAQEHQLLQDALAALPSRCREVFVLKRLHGLRQKTIAAQLGISEKTVEAHLATAMHKCVQFFAEAKAERSSRCPVAELPPVFVPVDARSQHA